jgi:hypothetical protein
MGPMSYGTMLRRLCVCHRPLFYFDIDRRIKYIRPLVYLIDRIYFEPNVSMISSEISGHKSRPDLESGTSMIEVKAT